MRAALIYQHATDERDGEIAAAMDKRINRKKKASKPKRDGKKDQGDTAG
jgi:hypothetical protein